MNNEIAELLAKLRSASSRRELKDILVAYYNSEGITMISYHGHFADGGRRKPMTLGFPEKWVRHYIDDCLDNVDPFPRLAAQRIKPFRWSEAEGLEDLSDDMMQFLQKRRQIGLHDGIALTVFGPNLRNSYVSLGFATADVNPSDEKILEFQWIAQLGHLRFCELVDQAAEDGRELSPREREVLDLIAEGKSNSVIAILMDISAHTVDAHVRSIYQKLGVNDRTSAAVVGLRRGILRYPNRK